MLHLVGVGLVTIFDKIRVVLVVAASRIATVYAHRSQRSLLSGSNVNLSLYCYRVENLVSTELRCIELFGNVDFTAIKIE